MYLELIFLIIAVNAKETKLNNILVGTCLTKFSGNDINLEILLENPSQVLVVACRNYSVNLVNSRQRRSYPDAIPDKDYDTRVQSAASVRNTTSVIVKNRSEDPIYIVFKKNDQEKYIFDNHLGLLYPQSMRHYVFGDFLAELEVTNETVLQIKFYNPFKEKYYDCPGLYNYYKINQYILKHRYNYQKEYYCVKV